MRAAASGPSAEWADVTGQGANDYLGLSFTVVEDTSASSAGSSLTVGGTYEFRIRATNKWGSGPFSDTLSVLAADEPSQIGQAVTTIEQATGAVVVSWTKPPSNGAEITSYTIEFSTPLSGW